MNSFRRQLTPSWKLANRLMDHLSAPGVLAGLLCLLLFGGQSYATDRPNILLLLVDDLKPAMGCYGDPVARTPHLDALASRGMRFDRAYCNQAVCAPSRFTLMLGSHSTSTGLYGLNSQLRDVWPDAITMPQHFARHGGYRTESLGKVFHIGHGNHGDPQSFQVPHFHDKVIEYLDADSTPGGHLTREEAYFSNQKLDQIRSLPRGAAFESPDVDDLAYADGRVAAETVLRLQAASRRRRSDGTPFFITAGFARPHLPFSVPLRYWQLYQPSALPMPKYEQAPDGAPGVAQKRGGEITNYFPVPEQADMDEELKRNLIHGYYAGVSYVDAQVGKVLAELRRLELEQETIVVLWGDHGFHLGDLGIWTKHTNYEQANRIPLLIVVPGVTQPSSVTLQPAESVDVFPTLAELAGLPVPDGPQPLDGISLVPVLRSPDVRVRTHAYHVFPKKKLGRAIRTERYRLVEWVDLEDATGAEPAAATAEYELYDYETDPLETRNLASERPDLVTELTAVLRTHPAPVGAIARRAPAAVGPGPEPASSVTTPHIAGEELILVAECVAESPSGVVLAQGGREHGFALHFHGGRPCFDVRIHGKVTRLEGPPGVRGRIRLHAELTSTQMRLTVNDSPPSIIASPGLIPVQPKDRLSTGRDDLSAAGDYEAPNPFHGTILSATANGVSSKPLNPPN